MDSVMTDRRTSGSEAFIAEWAPRMLSVLRIVAALLFLEHGMQKLFGIPAGPVHPDPFSLLWYAAVLELAGGALLLVTQNIDDLHERARAAQPVPRAQRRRRGDPVLLRVPLPVRGGRGRVER